MPTRFVSAADIHSRPLSQSPACAWLQAYFYLNQVGQRPQGSLSLQTPREITPAPQSTSQAAVLAPRLITAMRQAWPQVVAYRTTAITRSDLSVDEDLSRSLEARWPSQHARSSSLEILVQRLAWVWAWEEGSEPMTSFQSIIPESLHQQEKLSQKAPWKGLQETFQQLQQLSHSAHPPRRIALLVANAEQAEFIRLVWPYQPASISSQPLHLCTEKRPLQGPKATHLLNVWSALFLDEPVEKRWARLRGIPALQSKELEAQIEALFKPSIQPKDQRIQQAHALMDAALGLSTPYAHADTDTDALATWQTWVDRGNHALRTLGLWDETLQELLSLHKVPTSLVHTLGELVMPGADFVAWCRYVLNQSVWLSPDPSFFDQPGVYVFSPAAWQSYPHDQDLSGDKTHCKTHWDFVQPITPHADDKVGFLLLAHSLSCSDTSHQPDQSDQPDKTRQASCAPPQATWPGTRRPLDLRLSASGFSDWRTCPYRFWVKHLLKLREVPAIDTRFSAMDFGVWLHAVLQRFHQAENASLSTDVACVLEALHRAAAPLMPEKTWAEFLPFALQWASLAASYARWWVAQRAQGRRALHLETRWQWDEPRQTEATCLSDATSSQTTGLPYVLSWIGQVDRVDQVNPAVSIEPASEPASEPACEPEAVWALIDYKTEALSRSQSRVKDPLEDHQLLFYGALARLMNPRNERDKGIHVRGTYLNLNVRTGVQTVEHPDFEAHVPHLLDELPQEMDRLANGALLPALGAGSACTYCSAKGLCRKGFWAGGVRGINPS
jgi:RecB family exonuclease